MDEQTILAIKARMKELKMSQCKLAEELGINRNCISWWFTGKRNPSMENFYAMLSVLRLEIKIVKDE